MKKYILPLLVLAVLSVLLFHKLSPKEKNENIWTRIDDVSELHWKKNGVEYHFRKDGGQWQMFYPARFEINPFHFQRVDDILKHFEKGMRFDMKSAPNAEFFPEDELAFVEFIAKNGKHAFTVGKTIEIPEADAVRTWIKDDSGAYRIYSKLYDFGAIFNPAPEQWRQQILYTVPEKSLRQITVTTGNEQIVLDRSDGDWKIADFDHALSPQAVTQFLALLTEFRIEKFYDTADPKLDVVLASLDAECVNPNRKIEIRIGPEVSPEHYLTEVSFDGKKSFGLVSKLRLSLLLPTALQLRDRKFWDLNPFEIQKITVENNEKIATVAPDNNKKWGISKSEYKNPDGNTQAPDAALSEKKLGSFVRVFSKLFVARYVPESEKIAYDNAPVSVVFHFADKTYRIDLLGNAPESENFDWLSLNRQEQVILGFEESKLFNEFVFDILNF